MTDQERGAFPGGRGCERRDVSFAGLTASLLLCVAIFAAGCAAPGDPVERRAAVPQAIDDLAVHQSGNDAILTFNMPKETVERKPLTRTPSIEIFRTFEHLPPGAPASAAAKTETPELILTVPPAMADHYTHDGKVRIPNSLEAGDLTKYSGWTAEYTVRTGLSRKKLSPASNIAGARIYPAANPIGDLKATVTQDAVVLSWTAPQATPAGPAPPLAAYRIYRMQAPGSAAANAETGSPSPQAANPESLFPGAKKKTTGPSLTQIGEGASTEYSDKGFEFGATYVYSVRSVAQYPDEQLESADSNLVAVTPRDVFTPSVPQGLVVVYVPARGGSPAYLDLSWQINPETDLGGYNVYRSEDPAARGTRLNSQLLLTPSFRDMNAVSGRRYFYSVSATDRAGNESAPSAAVSGGIPAESQPSHDER